MDTVSLLDAVEEGATVVAANARAQRLLHRQYDARQQQQHLAWPTPCIFSWGGWLDSLWQEALLSGVAPLVRLNPMQELALWERIISESEAGRLLMATSSCAELARDAWRLLHEYCVADRSLLDATIDGSVFRDWSDAFEALCRSHRWMDSACLPERLCAAISEGGLHISRPIHLVGFDRLTPQQERFLASLREAGCVCDVSELDDAAPGDVSVLALNDSATEIQHAAEWARLRLLETPAASVGIIVPDLYKVRSRVQRVFTEVLAPEALLGGEDVPRAFELSLGRSLAAYPMVHTALQLLRWVSARLPIDEAGALLRSVYLRGGVVEASRRALLDVAMRRECGPEAGIAEVQRLAAERDHGGASGSHSCRVLALIVNSVLQQFDSKPKSPSGWSRHFSTLLQTAGWPGDRPLSSSDYQIWQAWLELLKSFDTLDPAWPVLSVREAIKQLTQCAAREVFQPENIGAPVQVLGPLEASGSRFDYLWVMGLDDETWPARARANPLLPSILQKRYRMPHAFAEDDLEFAKRVTDRLSRTAREVVFSYPRADGERTLRPSPLLAGVPQRDLSEVVPQLPTTWVGELSGSADALESLTGELPLQLQNDDLRGGSRVFQLQAACPFRAFAEFRLGAEAMEIPVPGLSASERGQLVHLVLQYVWQRLDSQSDLRGLTPDMQRELVASCVEEALSRERIAADSAWFKRFTYLERERLIRIVSAWLELEKARAPFKVIEREQKKEIEVGGLRVSVRVDRVDELEMGGKVILDYKTGAPKGNIEEAWDGERPDEPQLPLYAVGEYAGDDRLAGLAFAHVRTGENRFRGQTDALGVFPGVKPLVDQMLRDKVEQWRTALSALGERFLAGEVVVDPKKAETCRWCSVGPLCRRYEIVEPVEVTEEGDGDQVDL